MHLEVLAEDKSGSIALDHFLEKILGANGSVHTWRIHPYRGIGRLPKNLRGVGSPSGRFLLDNLPRVLRGYGKSLTGSSAVVVVVDADDRDCVDIQAGVGRCAERLLSSSKNAVQDCH